MEKQITSTFQSALIVCLIIFPVFLFAQNIAEKYANTITEKELKDMLYKYASDEFQGRETGTEGQKKAVEFLRTYYQAHEIKAAKKNGDYFQKVPLKKHLPTKGKMLVNEKAFSIGKEVYIMLDSEQDISTEEVIYLGYGIDDDKYSDYAKHDVSGKVILIKQGEPKDKTGNYVLSGTKKNTIWSKWDKKMKAARKHGATAIIAFTDLETEKELLKNSYKKTHKRVRMSLDDEKKEVQAEKKETEIVFVTDEVAKKIYPKILKKDKPKKIKLNLKIKKNTSSKEVDTENVIAYIEGHELPKEYVVISAHLDHEGTDSLGNVFNGADDDGSGTVAILEIAEAFKEAVKQGNPPKRSIVFLHVTGEEKGLLGSKYYTQNPVFPLANTVTNLNIDMIGRIDPKRKGKRNYVYLIGADKLSTELDVIAKKVNENCCGLELDYTFNDENDPNRFYYRSDHYNFAKHNIPIIFFFNGVHEDYHKITDTPDKINYDLLANRTKLIFHTAWEIANMNHRLVADKAK